MRDMRDIRLPILLGLSLTLLTSSVSDNIAKANLAYNNIETSRIKSGEVNQRAEQVELKKSNIVASNKVNMSIEIEKLNRKKLDDKLWRVGQLYNFTDIEFLRYIYTKEKEYKLQSGEIFALIAKETRMKDNTRVEKDGITSYGETQMRLQTAVGVYHKMVPRGKKITYPTDTVMRYNREYRIDLVAEYLRYLHDHYKDNHEVWTAYNRGIARKNAYVKRYGTYRTEYSKELEDIYTTVHKILTE
jgi:hypothetical protein